MAWLVGRLAGVGCRATLLPGNDEPCDVDADTRLTLSADASLCGMACWSLGWCRLSADIVVAKLTTNIVGRLIVGRE